MGKRVAQANLKRPAGTKSTQAILKRPAGKKDGEYWWNAPNDEEQVTAVDTLKRPAAAIEEDDGADEASTRDRMKGYYFHQSLKNGSLDSEVKAAWEKGEGQPGEGDRGHQRRDGPELQGPQVRCGQERAEFQRASVQVAAGLVVGGGDGHAQGVDDREAR